MSTPSGSRSSGTRRRRRAEGGPTGAAPDGDFRGPLIASDPTLGEETLRVGSVDGEDALSFVTGIAIDPGTGELHVPQRHGVLVFSDTGELRRVVGREGSGPGEEVPYIPRYRVDRGCAPR